jgi:diphthine-ammonia ligase
MCGVFGLYGDIDADVARASFGMLEHRGRDNIGEFVGANRVLFHCLHAIVGEVNQPLQQNGSLFLSNCEIYNWKEINEKYGFVCTNDAEVLFALLEMKGIEGLSEVDGVYAFAWENKGIVYLVRDILGVKPLCYVYDENVFAFASEGKALSPYGDVAQLLPTEILMYNIDNKTIDKQKRNFFSIKKEPSETKGTIMKQLEQKVIAAVEKRIAGLDHFGVLFSGGVDSTLLAFILQRLLMEIQK